MDKYEAKANYERLNDKLAETLGSERYFIKDDKVVKIDPALDLFMDLIVIRDATEKEIDIVKQKEAERIFKHIKEGSYLITLEILGKNLSSV